MCYTIDNGEGRATGNALCIYIRTLTVISMFLYDNFYLCGGGGGGEGGGEGVGSNSSRDTTGMVA